MPKISTGKIAKIINGLPHFGEVEIRVDVGNGFINSKCTGRGFLGQGILEDATIDGYDDWKQSAKDGIKLGFELSGKDANAFNVDIIRISGLDGTDTNPDVIKCASMLSIWDAVGYNPSPENAAFLHDVLKKSWKTFRIA